MSDILHQRARIGALSRSRTDDDPELVDARRNLAELRSPSTSKGSAAAPPLTDEQRGLASYCGLPDDELQKRAT
jgi:hypothetical protein